jgi:hypothetical protein
MPLSDWPLLTRGCWGGGGGGVWWEWKHWRKNVNMHLHIATVISYIISWGRHGRDRMVVEFTTTVPVQSVPITTKVVSLNPVHGEVYSIQHYVIKFVSDLWQVDDFSPVSSTNKTDRHDVTEILLKVLLNTITLPLNYFLPCLKNW